VMDELYISATDQAISPVRQSGATSHSEFVRLNGPAAAQVGRPCAWVAAGQVRAVRDERALAEGRICSAPAQTVTHRNVGAPRHATEHGNLRL
jgi:hypothetical protein